jgi:hypothetical protein
MPDKHGKPWAPTSSTKVGSILIPDGGFDCLEKSMAAIVKADRSNNMYVECKKGRHYLSSSVSDDRTEYVGFRLSPATITQSGNEG